MPGQPQPPVILEAFAKNAAPSYIQTPIPQTTTDPKRASFDLGFPPLTMTEIFAGGSAPYGQDVNGILNMLSAHILAAQSGQPYPYIAALATAMGGYAAGAVVAMADGSGVWLNNVAGNTTDPDGGAATGWVPLYNYGFANVTGLSGGITTLTRPQYRRSVIVLSGNLGGNQQVVLPNGTTEGLRSWLIVNTCVQNGFTVTVKTASGTGVTVPAGGFAGPTEVYGDGTNIYPTVAPITLPTDINPTPNTIALRTPSGYLFATYFNQTSPLENYSMAAVYGDAGDGFHRKISLANMAAQISLSQFAGQVAAAQVPAAAVTQYAALILANAALTGTPTAPTPPAGDNSTRIATTAFVSPNSVITGAGPWHRQDADGTIEQWGAVAYTTHSGNHAVTFPVTFPNACQGVWLETEAATIGWDTWLVAGTRSVSGFQFTDDAPGSSSVTILWRAIGR